MRILALALSLAWFWQLAAPAVAAEPGTLRIALSSSPNMLSPLLATQLIETFIGSMVLEGVVSATPDGKLLPVLAAVVPSQANGGISRDGLTITYKLRHGVRWHDGVPFTSRDVAFSQRARVDPNNNVTTRDPYGYVARMETPRDDTVIVHLRTRYAPFIAEWFPNIGGGILPAHLLAKYRELNDVPFNAAPIGTGPFIFDHWERGREIVFRANDAYALGKPSLHRVVVQLMADENSRNAALQTGETDWSFVAASSSAREFTGRADVVTRLIATNAHFGLTLQVRRPPLDDKRVRHAIAQALDRPSMVSKIGAGFASVASSDIGPDDWAYDPAIRALPFDPARSRALLASAGWKAGGRGMLERNGKPLSLVLVYAAGQTSTEAYAVQIQAMLRAVGIEIALKPEQANMLFAPLGEGGTLQTGRFDLALSSFYNTSDPNDRRVFGCAELPPNGFNDSRFCDAAYERATSDALLHADRATRKRDYARAARILVDEVPVVFIYWPKAIQLLRPGVRIDDGANNYALPYLWSVSARANATRQER